MFYQTIHEPDKNKYMQIRVQVHVLLNPFRVQIDHS